MFLYVDQSFLAQEAGELGILMKKCHLVQPRHPCKGGQSMSELGLFIFLVWL